MVIEYCVSLEFYQVPTVLVVTKKYLLPVLAGDSIDGKHDLSELYAIRPDGDEDGVEDKGAFIKAIFADYRKLAREAIMADERFVEFQADVRHRAERKATKQLEGFGQ